MNDRDGWVTEFIASDVVDLYRKLLAVGIQVWLVGGWGVDALLKTQTRAHKDLDILVHVQDLPQLWAMLERDRFALKELWPESLPVVDDGGVTRETAFVLVDDTGREIDIHALTFDELGCPRPAWNAGDWSLSTEDLAGFGEIEGVRMRCMSAAMQMAVHAEYKLPEEVDRSLHLLHHKFGATSGPGAESHNA